MLAESHLKHGGLAGAKWVLIMALLNINVSHQNIALIKEHPYHDLRPSPFAYKPRAQVNNH